MPATRAPDALSLTLDAPAPRAGPLPPIALRRDHLPHIDGLRAIAVAAVVLYHVGAWPFRSGFVGVDVFFVLSGYLIGGLLLRQIRSGGFRLAGFYARRARRIVPALLLVLAAAVGAGLLFLAPHELTDLASTSIACLLGAPNLRLWRSVGYFDPAAHLDPLLMTWSLGVEEQFYLLFPWALLALRRRSPAVAFAILAASTAALFGLAVWCTASFPRVAFFLPPGRAWELGLGATVAAAAAGGAQIRLGRLWREGLAIAAALALAASLVLFTDETPFPGLAAALPCLATAVLVADPASLVARRLLSARPAVAVGLVSYSWYLWHWPLITLVRLSAGDAAPIGALAATALLALVLAWLTWRWVETPFRIPRLAPRATLVRYAVAIGIALLVFGAIVAGAGLPGRVSPDVRRIEAAVAEGHAYPCLVVRGDHWNESPACAVARPGRPTLAILGDSHAAALGPGVRAWADAHGWGARVIALASCRPLLGVSLRRPDEPRLTAACGRFMTAAVDSLRRDPSVVAVVLAGSWGHAHDPAQGRFVDLAEPAALGSQDEILRRGLDRSIRLLAAPGRTVIVAGDTPVWPFDPPRRAIALAMPARRTLARAILGPVDPDGLARASVSTSDPGTVALLRAAAARPGARFVDLSPAFCSPARCRFRSGRTLLFMDRSHLSPAGAAYAIAATSMLEGLAPPETPARP